MKAIQVLPLFVFSLTATIAVAHTPLPGPIAGAPIPPLEELPTNVRFWTNPAGPRAAASRGRECRGVSQITRQRGHLPVEALVGG